MTLNSERKATIKYAKLSFSFYSHRFINRLTQLVDMAAKNQ